LLLVKKLSHLPILIDPSHGTGLRDKVIPMSRAAVAAGCDGLIVEVHYDADNALCDGAQSLYPEQYDKLYHSIKNSPLLLELLLKNSKNYNYFDFIKITLDQLSQKNNFYDIHIWGHSWEIEKEQLWEQLDDFLFFISTYHKQSCYPYSM